VTIPLTLTAASNLSITGTRGITADIVFNRSLLWPESATSTSGTVTMTQIPEGGDLRVRLLIDQATSPITGAQAEITCLVMLGNSESTPLRLENLAWLNGTASTRSTDGSLLVRGICEEGGPRLVALPTGLQLRQNSPNPFNPSTNIEYRIPFDGRTTLTIHDQLGRKTVTLVDEERREGTHLVRFDAAGLAAGTYVAVLSHGGERLMIRMLLVK
jgi:hypothetical protein